MQDHIRLSKNVVVWADTALTPRDRARQSSGIELQSAPRLLESFVSLYEAVKGCIKHA